MGPAVLQIDDGKLIVDKGKSINEIILKCVLEDEDTFDLNAVSLDSKRFCRGFPTCLGFNADLQVFPGLVR